jgi:hypothetical protein
MAQCDWCYRSIPLSFGWNFNEGTISIFMKITSTFYDTNQTLKRKRKKRKKKKKCLRDF